MVAVAGDLLLRTYKDTKGIERSAMQITANEVQFLNQKNRNDNAQPETNTNTYQQKAPVATAPVVVNNDINNDLPF